MESLRKVGVRVRFSRAQPIALGRSYVRETCLKTNDMSQVSESSSEATSLWPCLPIEKGLHLQTIYPPSPLRKENGAWSVWMCIFAEVWLGPRILFPD